MCVKAWCFYKPERKGKRWNKYNARRELYREWQEGEAFFWVDDEDDGQQQLYDYSTSNITSGLSI